MLFTSFLILSHLIGALTSVRAILEVRTSQGAIAWAIVLNTMPYFSVPAFWIFGRSKFKGYALARRKNYAQTNPAAVQYLTNLASRGLLANPQQDQALLTEKLARMPFTLGNDAELLVDGEATFNSIFEGIDQAKNYILVEFYILRDDNLGLELKRRLIEKARQGVRIFVLYDEFGNSKFKGNFLADIRNAGIAMRKFNSRQGRVNRWQLNFRNHRKIVIVDGQAAWVGGLNVGDEYMGRHPRFRRWRDTHVKVTGPVAQGVQVAFLEDWHWASRDVLDLNWDPQPAPSGAHRKALCLPTGPADELETCTLFFLNAINRATTTLWLASPYFVPDEQFVSALQLAALRGVDVRVLLPNETDNELVKLAGWSYLKDLEQVGIKAYRYQKGLMHQKVSLIDDLYCTIGTVNFDNRSFRLNFEITLAFSDAEFAGHVRRMLEQDFADSQLTSVKDLKNRGFCFRFAVRCARLLAPIL